jgi:hypothetical protein
LYHWRKNISDSAGSSQAGHPETQQFPCDQRQEAGFDVSAHLIRLFSHISKKLNISLWVIIFILDAVEKLPIKQEINMKLSAPKNYTFGIAVLLGVLGFIGKLVTIPLISGYAFWLVFLGFLLLAIGCFFDGI